MLEIDPYGVCPKGHNLIILSIERDLLMCPQCQIIHLRPISRSLSLYVGYWRPATFKEIIEATNVLNSQANL